jgi:hypothetical protein
VPYRTLYYYTSKVSQLAQILAAQKPGFRYAYIQATKWCAESTQRNFLSFAALRLCGRYSDSFGCGFAALRLCGEWRFFHFWLQLRGAASFVKLPRFTPPILP